jgi:carboxymethylenebutenolidase
MLKFSRSQRKEAELNHFQRYLIDEFTEDYQEGHLTRRDALKLIAGVTGSLLVANSILAACTPLAAGTPLEQATTVATATAMTNPTASAPAQATEPSEPRPTAESPATTAEPTEQPATQPVSQAQGTVSTDDPAVQAGDIEFPGDGATLIGYQAYPSQAGSAPIILMCHENRGLTDHIRDVTRRLAKAGYAALAVDLLSRQGGTATLGSDQVPGALGNTSPDTFVSDFTSGLRYMSAQSFAIAARVGMVGFCFGGGVTWLMATRMAELKAAVPFYGPNPPLEDIPNVRAAVLGIYGENDSRINAGIPAVEQAMLEYNKVFEKIIYPGAGHAFHNDTSDRYNAEAARDAWAKTLEWFGKYV